MCVYIYICIYIYTYSDLLLCPQNLPRQPASKCGDDLLVWLNVQLLACPLLHKMIHKATT